MFYTWRRIVLRFLKSYLRRHFFFFLFFFFFAEADTKRHRYASAKASEFADHRGEFQLLHW